MIIRKWLYTDVNSVFKIEKESFSDAWTKEMISDTFIQDNFIGFVAEENEKVIGYIALTYCLDEAEINIIAVTRDFRRKGVASALLNATYEALLSSGIDKIFLEVRKSNKSAQNLYKKHGFTVIGVRPKYYKGVEDAILMRKDLKE